MRVNPELQRVQGWSKRAPAGALALTAVMVVAGCAAHTEPARPSGNASSANASSGPAVQKLERQTLAQLVKRAEESEKKFGIRTAPVSDFRARVIAGAFWKQARPPIPAATVKTDGTRRWVVPGAIDPRANAFLQQAEPAYQERRFAEAAKLAEEATRIDPDSHYAWLYRGDCAFFAGDFQTALQHYDRALALNDTDYQVHFYRGNALLRLGRTEEGRLSFARALAAKPRHETLIDRIVGDDSLEFTIRPDLIEPKVRVTATGEGADIVVAQDRMEWLGYGICKALWLADDDYRRARGGGAQHAFSTEEELECLAALLVSYQRQVQAETAKANPTLDYVMEVVKAGDAPKLVIYELASRVDPQVTLTLPPEAREGLVDYVQKHVFMPRPGRPQEPARGGTGQLHGPR